MVDNAIEIFGDPYSLLKTLSEKLGNEGNIKDITNASYFQKLMTDTDKMVTKCILINILRATKDKNTIVKILKDGGWKTLHSWFEEAKSRLNKPFLLELLRLYHELPVTVDLLKQNSCAKDIKHLIKCNDEKISDISRAIIDRWMVQVKGNSGDSSKKDKSNDLTNHKSSKASKEGINNAQSKVSDNLSNQSRHKSQTSEDKNLSLKSSNDFDMSSNSSSNSVVSKDTLQRPKTVKMIGSKFRSTGLELESPLPKAKKKSTSTQNNPLTVSSGKKSAGQQDKKMTVAVPSSVNTTTASSSPPVEVKPKPKIVQPKPRPPEIFESSGFMDALAPEILPAGRRKRRLSQNIPIYPKSSSTSNTSSSSTADEKKPSVPTFYREITETTTSTEKADPSLANLEELSTTSVENDSEMTEMMNDREAASEEGKSNDTIILENDETGTSLESMEPPTKKKKVKTVSWADEAQLCSYFYFQLDETERVNVNKIVDFAETRKHELEMERQMFQNVKRMAHDTMAAKTQWRKPSLITGIVSVVIPGCNSTERKSQIEREQSVLQVLYFNKSMIPETAVEPDLEYFEMIETKDIPLTDETGAGSCSSGEICYDRYALSSSLINNPDIAPLINNLFNPMLSSQLAGEMIPTAASEPQQQQPPMMPQIAPGPMPPFMQPMFNMPPNMHGMPPNMNMPMMNGRQIPNNITMEMQGGPNQGPMMLQPRPGMMRAGGPGFPPMRPDFMMGPGPQNHPAMMGGGDMEMNRMHGMPPVRNPQEMPQRMMGPREMQDAPSRGHQRNNGKICNNFTKHGFCRFGVNCRFIHPRDNGSPH